jgi:hypothetical protein
MFSQDGDEPGDTGIADRDGWLEQRGRMIKLPINYLSGLRPASRRFEPDRITS